MVLDLTDGNSEKVVGVGECTNQQYGTVFVSEPAGASIIGSTGADTDFRLKGMVVLVGFSCSLGYK